MLSWVFHLCTINLLFADDYLILRRPVAAYLFDTYESALSAAEKKALPKNLPLKRIETDGTLGDQITRVDKFSYQGQTWSVLKENTGYSGLTEKQDYLFIKNVKTLNDTVIWDEAAPLSITEPVENGKSIANVTQGETLIRYFKQGNKIYISYFKDLIRFGYTEATHLCQLTPIEKKAGVGPVLFSNDILTLLDNRLQKANDTYARLFAQFNQITGQDKSAPIWQRSQEGGGLHCELKGIRGNRFEESNRYLLRDIEGLFLGKPVRITAADHLIQIMPRVSE
ncbi:MAG: hypothetical protein A2293_01755 [Elusimicrobia bacterium RIFOXYB2_FULL_49_7]|nr:MAG: hypothetical protein A2293_01755 [Elusimicrobia bacterium RIFOXYB2_FULL_49_7]